MISGSSFMSSQELPQQTLSWWKRLEDVLKRFFAFIFRNVFKTSSSRRIYSPYSYVFRRRLQDVIKTNIFALLIRLQRTSWSRPNIFVLVIRLQDVFKMFSRHLQDVFKMSCQNIFKMSSRCLAKASSRHLQEEVFKKFFKTSSRRLQEVFKASTRHLPKTFSRRLQNVFKTSSRRFLEVLETSSRRFQDASSS